MNEQPTIARWENPQLFWYLIIPLYTLLNLLFAGLTPLFDDEAFFWTYSTVPSLGYYEHPPMVALAIGAGCALIPGELGIRLFFVLLNTLTLILMILTLRQVKVSLIVTFSLSVFAFAFAGFMAAPDSVLAFWIACYLYLYSRFTSGKNWWITLFWGVVMAAMIYSKYNSGLLILLTLLSNLSLLRQKHFYAAGIVAILVFIPHLWWLYQNNFMTLVYHLFERSDEPGFGWNHLGDFLAGQILLLGPVMWFFIFPVMFRSRAGNLFERGLMFMFWGTYIFFLLYLLRSRVEANWTAPAFIPALLMTARWFDGRPEKVRRRIYITGIISFVLILGARTVLMLGVGLPVRSLLLNELKKDATWAAGVTKVTRSLPAVYISSYQKPSKLMFYEDALSFPLTPYDYHLTQFTFRPDLEEKIQGRTVMLMTEETRYNNKYTFRHTFRGESPVYCTRIENFHSFYTIPVIPGENSYRTLPGDSLKMMVSLVNTRKDTLMFRPEGAQATRLVYHLLHNHRFILEEAPLQQLSGTVLPGDTLKCLISVPPPKDPGEYSILVSLKTGNLVSTRHGMFIEWKVGEENPD